MKFIFEYIKKYKMTYIGVVIIFIIGIIIGGLMIFKTSENDKAEIKEYVEQSIDTLKNNKENKEEIFIESFKSNAKFALIIWFLGCTIIAGFTIYILMIYKGFLLGYIISAIINIFGIKQGIIDILILLCAQNIVFLPVTFLLATSGIRLYKGIIKKEINLKYEILRHSVIIVITLGIAIISSGAEAYITTFFL